MFYRRNELIDDNEIIFSPNMLLFIKPRVSSRFPKKTSKVWSELCGPRARHSEGCRRKTTVFKVISFKRLSCPKSAKSLLADYCGSALKGRDLTTKRGWRTGGGECDSVLGMPLLLGHFLYPHPSFLPWHSRPSAARSGSCCFSLPDSICFFSSLKAASSHSLTLMSTILY